MPRLDNNERIRYRGALLTVVGITAMITVSAATNSCLPDTETFVCDSGRRCPAGQVCALRQDICIDIGGCGDGHIGSGEVCDDGNVLDDDGCSHDCTSIEICGNGKIDSREECDDGNLNDGDGCSSKCTLEACGNLIIDVAAGEACDDGNEISGDGCSADCKSNEACGNGIIDIYLGEECEFAKKPFPHHFEDTAQCDNDCTFPVCGDGHRNTVLEDCDPGIMFMGMPMDSKGCDNDCTFVECGDHHTNQAAGEECDNGSDNSNLPNAECRKNCHKASCGDGILDKDTHDPNHPNEMCDDGNDNTNDDCPSGPGGSCKPATCGDGFVNTTGLGPHEECDPPESTCSDGTTKCDSNCQCK